MEEKSMNVDLGINKVLELLSEKIQAWVNIGIKSLPNVVVAIVIVFVFSFIARYAAKASEKILRRVSSHEGLRSLASSAVQFTIVMMGIFVALGVLNLDKAVTSVLAGAGVIGLALGFAFQDIASNFISGLFIAFKKPYAVGDIVQSGDHMGNVTSIDIRTTTITTFQGLEIMVPNKILFTEPLTNYTNRPRRRIDLGVGFSYGDDLSKVEKLLVKELESLPNRITSEDVDVFYKEFGDSSINLDVHIWVEYSNNRKFLETQSEAIKKIKSVFDANDIMIPFPIRTLDFGIKGGVQLHKQLPKQMTRESSSEKSE